MLTRGEMSVQQAGTDIRVLRELEEFPLVEGLFGRRSRRFARGGESREGPLAYRSGQESVPLSGLERMLVLGVMGGTTGWYFSITRHARYAPHVSGRGPDPRPGVQGLRRGAGVVRTRSACSAGTPGRRGG